MTNSMHEVPSRGRLAIFGTGGMARELADVALRQFERSKLVFVVDDPQSAVQGIEVISPAGLRDDDRICIGVGNSSARKAIAARFADRKFVTVISDTSRISLSAEIGPGAAICDYTLINNNASIGSHFQCNVFTHVSHDCTIGDFVTLSPRVSCNGWIEIGDEVFVGAGAVIRNGAVGKRLTIGPGAIIGMGAVVTKDVPEGATVYGNPARVICK